MVVLIPILSLLSLADAMPGYKDHGNSLETRQDTSLNCGNWATGSRASAQALQKQLLACDDNLWGKSFTVAGTADVKSGSPSPCIGLACDYVSTTDFHHTQFQLCNDGPHAVTKNCTEIAYWAQKLIDDCCADPSSDGISGQYFLGDGTNIDVSWSDSCRTKERPSDPGDGMGQCVAAS